MTAIASDFTLHSDVVAAADAAPSRHILFLHGIYGRGGNWRSIARRVVDANPTFGARLVDLRNHGRSVGAPQPHSLDTTAADVERLAGEIQGDVALIVGHSFGGKVALQLRHRGQMAKTHTLVLDASPTANPEALSAPTSAVAKVLDALEALPERFETREGFADFMKARSFAPAVVAWLATNVVPDDGAYRFSLDAGALRAMLQDYFATDLWSATRGGAISVLAAGRDSSIEDADKLRYRETEGLDYQELAEAGHWLHADAPDDVVAAISSLVAKL